MTLEERYDRLFHVLRNIYFSYCRVMDHHEHKNLVRFSSDFMPYAEHKQSINMFNDHIKTLRIFNQCCRVFGWTFQNYNGYRFVVHSNMPVNFSLDRMTRFLSMYFNYMRMLPNIDLGTHYDWIGDLRYLLNTMNEADCDAVHELGIYIPEDLTKAYMRTERTRWYEC